jgi:enediyne biosynthesis protein E4
MPIRHCFAALAAASAPVAAADTPWFVDLASAAGVEFHYVNGGRGEYWFPEIMGGGVALFDYDGDGLLDIYLVQGGALGPGIGDDQRGHGDRLLRNVSTRGADGRLQLRFEDVTESAGIRAFGYGMGVAIGDINGNGHPDIYVLNFGPNQLWRNNGDGTFTEIAAAAGVDDPSWSVSASFADLDGDGLPELYVANYAEYDFDSHRQCRAFGTSEADYCSPSAYPGSADRLYRNLGDGRFTDISAAAGIGAARGRGLGVIAADFNGNGRIDLYVANDGDPNFLWLNQGELRFVDEALLAGAAVNAGGAAEAGMGVDAADFNRSGSEDIFLTHMKRETNTLYANDGQGWFEDVTAAAGLAAPSIPYTGFGTAWLDIDNDGWLDLIVVNGAVMKEQALADGGDPFPYAQPNQIFRNRGDGRFEDASRQGGPAFARALVSRGAAFGDLDNDGRIDVVVANNGGPLQVLMNRTGSDRHWLGLDLRDGDGRVATGAVAWLQDAAGATLMRRARADGSYASANDPRIVFGLGAADAPRSVRVRWPDGSEASFSDLASDRYHVLRKGVERD